MYRALSLLLLDALAITSAAKSTNLLVDFVPFAVGAVVVLCKCVPALGVCLCLSRHSSGVQLRITKKGERDRSLVVVILQ